MARSPDDPGEQGKSGPMAGEIGAPITDVIAEASTIAWPRTAAADASPMTT
jgi:hypothetical protein